MNRRLFLTGLLMVPIGMALLLYFSASAHPYATALKWLGVGVMIGGPFVCWEVLPDLVELLTHEDSH